MMQPDPSFMQQGPYQPPDGRMFPPPQPEPSQPSGPAPYPQAGFYPPPDTALPTIPSQQPYPYMQPNPSQPYAEAQANPYPPLNPYLPPQQANPYAPPAPPPRVSPPRVVQAGGLVDRWWVVLPATLRRYSLLLSEAWSDGLYLSRWAQLSVLLAGVALLLGLAEGAAHLKLMINDPIPVGGRDPGPPLVYTELFPFLLLVTFAGAISANYGLMLLLGYALGDLLFFALDPARLAELGPLPETFTDSLLYLRAPQLISYGLLAMLAVIPTLSSKNLAAGVARAFKLTEPTASLVRAVVMAAAQGAIVYAWTLSAPLLIRVFWGWTSATPPMGAAYYLQNSGGWMIGAAVVGVLIREWLSFTNLKLPDVRARAARLELALREADARLAFTRRIPSVVRSLLAAFYLTLLVSGFIGSLVQGIIVFVIVLFVFIGRSDVLPRFPFWVKYVRFVTRIPLVLRLLAAVLIAYVVTSIALGAIENNPNFLDSQGSTTPSGTFYPMVISMCLSLLVMTVVLPRPLQGRPQTPASAPPAPPVPPAPSYFSPGPS